VRAELNKNIGNKLPKTKAQVVLGGDFDDETGLVTTEPNKYFAVDIQQQQIGCILKFLEFTGNYSKFQTGVLSKYYKREFKPAEE